MIYVLIANGASTFDELLGKVGDLANFDLIVADGTVVKDRHGTRDGQRVDSVDRLLDDLARENPGRAADVDVTVRTL